MQEVAKCLRSKSCFLAIIKIYEVCSTSHVMTLVQALTISQRTPPPPTPCVMSRSEAAEAGISMHLDQVLYFTEHTHMCTSRSGVQTDASRYCPSWNSITNSSALTTRLL